MKDDAPRIFRSLEMRQGREGFDTIVTAAVASYGSLRSPSEAQAREFGRLVAPAWDKIMPETRRALAASLSHSPRVPREIVEKLIASPVEISAPFLVSSPALTGEDLRALTASGDDRVRKILASREPAPASRQPSETGSTGSLRDGDAPAGFEASPPAAPAGLGQTDVQPVRAAPPRPFLPSPPLVPGHLAGLAPAEAKKAADTARDTLLHLAKLGRSRPASSPEPVSLARLIALATEGDADAFYADLRSALHSTPERIGQIADDATGEVLAVALKALKASPADAMTVLMMLKPAIGLDVGAFESMTRLYRALKTEECRQLLHLSRAPATAPRLQPQFAGPEPHRQSQPQPRSQFGRRKTRPAAVLKTSDQS